eukprot:6172629-Pleurochrysis_carterae.AAC.5
MGGADSRYVQHGASAGHSTGGAYSSAGGTCGLPSASECAAYTRRSHHASEALPRAEAKGLKAGRFATSGLECKVLRVAQLLRRCRHALLLEYTKLYKVGEGRPPTMAEMVEEHDTKVAQLEDK